MEEPGEEGKEPTGIEPVIAVLQTAPLATWVRLPGGKTAGRTPRLLLPAIGKAGRNAPASEDERLIQSGRRDSNSRYPAWEAGVLPLNYSRTRLSYPAYSGIKPHFYR